MNFFIKNKVKKFYSKFGWFEMSIPLAWEEYEDEEGTYAFFDPDDWKGNFRVTAFQLDRNADDTAIENLLNKSSSKIKIGDKNCVYYKEEIESEDEHSIMYCWHFYILNYVFMCTFTINHVDEDLKKTKAELSKIALIIESVKIL